LIVIGDTLTRFAWAYPIRNERVETVTRALLDGWILRYGPPKKLLSDRGTVFLGKVLDHMCKIKGIKKVFTSSYHPQTDGFVAARTVTAIYASSTLTSSWRLLCYGRLPSLNASESEGLAGWTTHIHGCDWMLPVNTLDCADVLQLCFLPSIRDR
jgi:transposase InsO family protein